MSDKEEVTTFEQMYDYFLGGITDDMYMSMTKQDTEQLLEEILVAAMPHFEFPHWNEKDVLDLQNKCFKVKLTNDEMRIIRSYMIVEWLGYQIANVDLIRQKYTSSDFSMTSQANHLKQLVALRDNYKTEAFHLQRLYSRKEYNKSDGRVHSSFHKIIELVGDTSNRYDR